MDPSRDEDLALLGRFLHNGGSVARQPECGLAGGTAAAGTYLPNAWGLYDLHGNVGEWCLDWWTGADFAATPVADPSGPAGPGTDRVVRGGCLSSPACGCRSAGRGSQVSSLRQHITGFRIVLPAGPSPLSGPR